MKNLSLHFFVYLFSHICGEHLHISMPNVKPTEPETYLCTPLKLNKNQTLYVVGFEAKADAQVAHHILLYGCQEPGHEGPVYNCGEMEREGLKNAKRPCAKGTTIIYAWAQNAPELKLPDKVAFEIGGLKSRINWLVLQVHYASIDHIPQEGDTSGVSAYYQRSKLPKRAGLFLMWTQGVLPPQKVTHMEVTCPLREHGKVIHPFAFRVHTHGLGDVVSGWKVEHNKNWSLLGKADPQLPQMFFPTENKLTLTDGDKIAARCTMDNFRNHTVRIGFTKADEMCNFYLMYWVEGSEILRKNFCWSLGPPYYSWNDELENIPELEASEF